jgi:hypothetical protein
MWDVYSARSDYWIIACSTERGARDESPPQDRAPDKAGYEKQRSTGDESYEGTTTPIRIRCRLLSYMIGYLSLTDAPRKADNRNVQEFATSLAWGH